MANSDKAVENPSMDEGELVYDGEKNETFGKKEERKKLDSESKANVKKDEEFEKKESGGKKRKQREPSSAPFVERLSRERKAIKRFVPAAEKGPKVREFKIKKGSGTPLRDIPNVAFRLSKKRGSDELMILLHQLLYGKRVKTRHVKQNILQFSGFVCDANEEKEKAKFIERLEKCIRENLLRISVLLDLNPHKTFCRKEDLVANLFQFLECPQKTTEMLLEDTQQKKKGKRKRNAVKITEEQASRKRQKLDKTSSTKPTISAVEGHDKGDDSDDGEKVKVKIRKVRKNKIVRNVVDKKEGSSKKEVTLKRKASSEKTSVDLSTKLAKMAPAKLKPQAKQGPPKVNVEKKKNQEIFNVEEGKKTKKARNSRKSERLSGSKISTFTEGEKHVLSGTRDPSDAELEASIRDILKDTDFGSATFANVLERLEKELKADLSERKSVVKILIREEITRIAEQEEKEDHSAVEGAEKD